MTNHQVMNRILTELERAQSMYPPIRSEHEGYAILLEEISELWIAIMSKTPSRQKVAKEACHVSAMAARFLTDLFEKGG